MEFDSLYLEAETIHMLAEVLPVGCSMSGDRWRMERRSEELVVDLFIQTAKAADFITFKGTVSR